MSTSHARPGILARFAARFADDPSQPRIARIGIPGMTEWVTVPAPPAPGPQERHSAEQHPPWECASGTGQAPAPGEAPVHMAADEYGIVPCCGQHETQVPGWQADDLRLVTCNAGQPFLAPEVREATGRTRGGSWYGWGDTAPDHPPAHDRPYVPEVAPPYVPDFRSDYRDLPVFRATLRVRGWCGLAAGNRAGTLPDFGLRRAA